ncbi:hypothetical protein ACWY2R_15905 [Enterococcus avium]|uniref:hypothetical protein n=1 Tax=Enterococcus sp. TaxID=35783 RepID=UPI00290BA332|nr:hypothetical protein [Enterococcus sp.]MDU5336879.1 hypothetical protein [Enterococcus sp.]
MLDELFNNLSRENLQNKFSQAHSENFDNSENLESKEKITYLAEFLHAIYVVKTIESSSSKGLSSCKFESITLDELSKLLQCGLDVQFYNSKWIISWSKEKQSYSF